VEERLEPWDLPSAALTKALESSELTTEFWRSN
jgi:hypothetical protein